MKAKHLFIWLFISLIIVSGFTALFYSFYIVKDVRRITADLVIENTEIVGMNTDADGLHFGTVPRKGTSIKRMIINHKQEYPLLVSIHSYGNFLQWLNISDINFVVYPNEDKEIKFTVKIPEDAPFGVYNGTLLVVMRRSASFS